MADQKKPELSKTYHDHKRTSLLTSGALFLTSLPGVKISSSLLGVIETGPLPNFARLLLAIGSVYYLLNFCLIWFNEAYPYARGMDDADTDLDKELSKPLAKISEVSGEILRITELLQLHATALSERGSELVAVRADKVEQALAIAFASGEAEIVEQYRRFCIDNIRGLLSQFAVGVDNLDGIQLYNAVESLPAPGVSLGFVSLPLTHYLTNEHSDYLARGSHVAELERLTATGTAALNPRLDAIAGEIRKVRSAVLVAPWSRRILLIGIDLAAPAVVFVIAALHFIGDLMPHPWWNDAATIWARAFPG